MNYFIDIPLIVPIDASAMTGQIGMQQLNLLGVLVVMGFIATCGVIGWKIRHASTKRPAADHMTSDRHDLDQAA